MAIKKSTTTAAAKDKDIKYEVVEECGELTPRKNGDVVKVRYLSWNGRDPKYDIRAWSTDDDGNERCGKGIGMSGEELEELYEVIGKLIKED